MTDETLIRFAVAGTTSPAISACRACYEAGKARVDAGEGEQKIPALVAGGPNDQPCEHLAAWVRANVPEAK